MKRVTWFASIIAIAVSMTATVPAHASNTAAASQYIERLGNQALAAISEKGASKQQKQAKLERIFAENVDFKWVGRFVMGRYWRDASEAQKSRYLKEYQKFLILNYTSRFADYTGGNFKVSSTEDQGDDEYKVSMEMSSGKANEEPVYVDYRVRKEGSNFRIFDVIVEGVSLIATQRSEFGSVLSTNGIDYLINQLAEKAKSPTPDDMKLGSK